MNEARRQPTRGLHQWLALTVAVTMAFALWVSLSGCGNVADVGVGASQGSVQPVSGAYGYGSSSATSAQLQDQAQKVQAVARENAKPDSKAAAATLKAVKTQPDATGETVSDATAEVTPPLEPQLMSAIVSQEQGAAPAVTGGNPPVGPGG
jgi:hypothetical protein